MKRSSLALLFLLGVTAAWGQDTTARTEMDPTLNLGKISLGGMIGAESIISESWGGRVYLGVPFGRYFYVSFLTTAITRSQHDTTIRVSANGILSAATLLGFYMQNVFVFAIVPHMLLNPTFDMPIIGTTLSAVASGRTDWYAFSKGGKFSMEGSLGLRLRLGRAVLEGRCVLPILQGYLDDKDPMIGINLYYSGMR